jgi:deoxyhypusine synthase
MDKREIVKKNLFRESSEVDGTVIKGYDFNSGVDWSKLVDSFASAGFQASHLSKAISVVNKMVEDGAFIYLGYTSNMVSSGNREVIRYLVEHKKVDVLVTTCGGIEEDIIKCLGDFVLGDFDSEGVELREKGVNRIGNIFVPNSRYVKFEEFLQPLLQELFEEQKRSGKRSCASEMIWKLGEKINDSQSICYWAWKNSVRIFCPAISDGAIGDNIYFFKLNNPDFEIDLTEDIKLLDDTAFGHKKTGVIILGAGLVKHAILNTNMLRNGADYAVYINTAVEWDGSDSGALPSEAVSWGKLKVGGESVKVFGDATILFPILVGKSFAKEK